MTTPPQSNVSQPVLFDVQRVLALSSTLSSESHGQHIPLQLGENRGCKAHYSKCPTTPGDGNALRIVS
jgi:hypothetical protein